jgi:hypothetical protein
LAEKSWLKVLFADLLGEKNTVPSLKQYGSFLHVYLRHDMLLVFMNYMFEIK